MVWGLVKDDNNDGTLLEHILKPLGLVCYGGEIGTNYTIHGIKNEFKVNIHISEIGNIEKIYTKWLRKKKLEEIEK